MLNLPLCPLEGQHWSIPKTSHQRRLLFHASLRPRQRHHVLSGYPGQLDPFPSSKACPEQSRTDRQTPGPDLQGEQVHQELFPVSAWIRSQSLMIFSLNKSVNLSPVSVRQPEPERPSAPLSRPIIGRCRNYWLTRVGSLPFRWKQAEVRFMAGLCHC